MTVFSFQNVTIDVCSLEHDIALLQQACDITDGVFFKVPNLSALLQYLLVRLIISIHESCNSRSITGTEHKCD